jgi:hypothetical protein
VEQAVQAVAQLTATASQLPQAAQVHQAKVLQVAALIPLIKQQVAEAAHLP